MRRDKELSIRVRVLVEGRREGWEGYLWIELELHHVADFGFHVLGLEGEIAVLVGDFDDVHAYHTTCRSGRGGGAHGHG